GSAGWKCRSNQCSRFTPTEKADQGENNADLPTHRLPAARVTVPRCRTVDRNIPSHRRTIVWVIPVTDRCLNRPSDEDREVLEAKVVESDSYIRKTNLILGNGHVC